MASCFKRRTDTGNGDGRQPQDDLVAMCGGTCLEDGCLFQNGTAEMRLPGVLRAGKSPASDDVGTGEDIKQKFRADIIRMTQAKPPKSHGFGGDSLPLREESQRRTPHTAKRKRTALPDCVLAEIGW